MEYSIHWKPEEQNDYRRNGEISEILLDTMEELIDLDSGASILEIGGGNGIFSAAAAARGYVPTVLDCEEALLQKLPSSIAAISADWSQIEESDPALTGPFHAVVSNFSTAVQSVEELRKMNHTATEWCVLNRLLMYKEPVLDRIARSLDLPDRPILPKLKQDYISVNANAVMAGHRPEVHFNDFTWNAVYSPQEAADHFMAMYYAGKSAPEGIGEQALQAAEKMAANGTISGSITAHVAHLFWNVNYR